MQNFDEIKNYAKSVLSEKRFVHTVNVAEEARRLALIWGEDPDKAYVAGLIHDIAKEIPANEARTLLLRAVKAEKQEVNLPKVAVHGFLAAYIAKETLGICDEDVLAAAKSHTTGRVGMSNLEKIIYIADFTEPGRNFPEADEVRSLSEKSLDEAVLREADFVIKFVIDSGRPLCTDTVEVRNSFLTKIKEDK